MLDPDALEMLGGDGPAISGLPETVNSRTLALLLGISANRLGALAREGVIPRRGKTRFPLPDAVSAYCKWCRDNPAGRPAASGALADAKVRLTTAQAERAEMQAAATRGEMIPAADVEAGWAGILRDVRAAVLALSARARTRLPHLTPTDVAEIDREARQILVELSDAD